VIQFVIISFFRENLYSLRYVSKSEGKKTLDLFIYLPILITVITIFSNCFFPVVSFALRETRKMNRQQARVSAPDYTYKKVKVKQSRYRPGVAQRVPGS